MSGALVLRRAPAGLAFLATVAVVASLAVHRPAPAGAQSQTGHAAGAEMAGVDPAAVVIPVVEGTLALGQRAFGAKCAACHSETLTGIEGAGPPLLHPFYVPGHHGDGAIHNAVRNGTPAHHWTFGDMPPVKGLTEADIAAIIGYVRTVQQANGIR